MTGRELIIYILANNLENYDLFSNSLSPLLVPAEKVATKWECGIATVKALIDMNKLRGIKMGDQYYVLGMEQNPYKKKKGLADNE